MIFILDPGYSVGPFRLGDHIGPYCKQFDFEIETIGERDPTTFYSIGDDFTITLDDDGRIEALHCHGELLYRGANLIGMSLQQLEVHTDTTYVGEPDSLNWEDDDIPQIVYEFETLGLQVWIKREIVVTIIASTIWEEVDPK